MKNGLSIIIPVFNSAETVGRTLRSLLLMPRESRARTEVIVVDDGSTDGSAGVVMSMQGELSPAATVVVRQENMGTSVARNTGLERSSGDWIFFLDADDELAFDPLSFIQKCPEALSMGFAVQYHKDLRPAGRLRPVPVTHENHLDIFTARNAYTASSLLFRKDRLAVPFDPLFFYLEDWLFWIQNPGIFEGMTTFPGVTSAIIHAHGGNKTSNQPMHGKYRQRVAEKVLSDPGARLSLKHKNNLLIQSQIGMLQQGLKLLGGTFLRLPCDPLLYLKLVVYSILRGRFSSLDIYGG